MSTNSGWEGKKSLGGMGEEGLSLRRRQLYRQEQQVGWRGVC